MGEHGGCGVLFAVMLVVAAIFGAGYLLATDQLGTSTAEAAAALAEAEIKLAAAEEALKQSRAEVDAARAEANQLREALAALEGQDQRAAELEAENARLRQAVMDANEVVLAKIRLLEQAQNTLDEETARRMTAEQRAAELEGIIPASGGGAGSGKQISSSLITLAMIGLGGILATAVITLSTREHAVRQSRSNTGEVMVRMTREEARAYARWRARR